MARIRLKIPSLPALDEMSKSYQEERELGVDQEKSIREAMSAWASSLPENPHKDFATSAKIQSLKTAPMQRFSLVTWFESRSIDKRQFFGQVKHEIIRLNGDDIWSFASPVTNPKEAKEEKVTYAIYGTLTKEQCDSGCGGGGALGCPKCLGKKNLACAKCQGARKEKCTVCRGSGSISEWVERPKVVTSFMGKEKLENVTSEEHQQCMNCRGSGEQDCRNCGGDGLLICTNCNPEGLVVCPGCNGVGEKSFYAEMSITKTPVVKQVYFFPKSYGNLREDQLPKTEDADFVPIIEEFSAMGGWSPGELWDEIPKEMKQACDFLSKEEAKKSLNSFRLVGQSVVFEQTPGVCVEYSYDSRSYPLWFLGLIYRLVSADSPFRGAAENEIQKIKIKLSENKVLESLREVSPLLSLSESPVTQETYEKLLDHLRVGIDIAIRQQYQSWKPVAAQRLIRASHALGMKKSYWHSPAKIYTIATRCLFFALACSLLFYTSVKYQAVPKVILGGLVIWAYLAGALSLRTISKMRVGADWMWKILVLPTMLASGGLWWYGALTGMFFYSFLSLASIFAVGFLLPKAQPKEKYEVPANLPAFLYEELLPFRKFFDRKIDMPVMAPAPLSIEEQQAAARKSEGIALQKENERAADSLLQMMKEKK